MYTSIQNSGLLSPQLSPLHSGRDPQECARGSNVESVKSRKQTSGNTESKSPAVAARSTGGRGRRPSPGEFPTTAARGRPQVMSWEAPGSVPCLGQASQPWLRHPARLLAGSPEAQAMLLSELFAQKSWKGLSEEAGICLDKERRTAGTKPTPAAPGGSVEGWAGCLPCRVQGAGHTVLEGDLGAFPGDLFLLDSHGLAVPIPGPGQGLVCTPTLSRQPGPGPGPELPRPKMGNLSKSEVPPKVGTSQALCSLISSGAPHRASCSGTRDAGCLRSVRL